MQRSLWEVNSPRSQEEATLPEATAQKKNIHQTQQGDLQYTLMSTHMTGALSSCSVAWLLSVSVWGMSHIHSFSENRPQVHEHTINSPTPVLLMIHWTSLPSPGTYWQTKDKGELSPTAKKTPRQNFLSLLIDFSQ